ncbi:MAG: GGDEF domain-containing protein [Halanaerobacter sp.]
MKNIFNKLKYPIIITLFLTIIFISFMNYENTKEIIKDKYYNQSKVVENSIVEEISYINNAYKIAEEELNEEMKKYSLILKEKYRQNPDISSWDLEKLKERFGEYNIYIVNSDLQVVRTTFAPDKGLDFSKYPSFSKLLKSRLAGDSFTVDRLNISTQTGKMKKYSYIPTHDHQYLLELGINAQRKYTALKELDIFTDAEDMTEKYDVVEEVLFYKFSPKSEKAARINDQKPYMNSDISEGESEMVKRTYLSQQVQIKDSQNEIYSDKYLPVLVTNKESEDSWWNSFVVRIKYNKEVMLDEIKKQRNLFLINGLIMVAVFITFIVIVVYLLNKFEHMAYYDKLTGLANREFFTEKVENMLRVVNRNNDKLAILFLDIDNFKEINDNFGHDTGDLVLEKVALRLKDNVRENDIISRLGGDEFTVAISDIDSREDINSVVTRAINSFNQPLIVDKSKLFISVSIGVSIYPDDGEQLEDLIQKADHAMYKAKKEQKSCVYYENR